MSDFLQTVEKWLSDTGPLRQALVVVGSTAASAKKAANRSAAGRRTTSCTAADIDQDTEQFRKALARATDVLIVSGLPRTVDGMGKAKLLITEQQVALSGYDPHARYVRTPKLIFCTAAKGFVPPAKSDRRFIVVYEAAP